MGSRERRWEAGRSEGLPGRLIPKTPSLRAEPSISSKRRREERERSTRGVESLSAYLFQHVRAWAGWCMRYKYAELSTL